MNLTPKIKEKMGRCLHNKTNHPINIIKNKIYRLFDGFNKFDEFDSIVTIEDNFDNLLIPKEHPSRSSTDTYYVDDELVLRTHTSAHQCRLLSKGYTNFLVTGDVYRKDAIDRYHHPVFHQIEGVSVCCNAREQLHKTIIMLLGDLFPKCKYHCIDSIFPFTEPSWEYEVKFGGRWIEILGCGIIHPKIIQNCGLDGEEGWAFGLGLDRLTMLLFDIPDIRLLWSEDKRFLGQFRDGMITKFVSFSKQPICHKDVAFWLPEDFNYNVFCETVREIGDDLVESIKEIDSYSKNGLTSKCYRISYRGIDRILTDEEVDRIQEKVRRAIVLELKGDLR